MKKWYTCTPVAFKGDDTFFYRDSGLLSRAFAEAGCESRAVMPLPVFEGDWPELIRTEYGNLEDSCWWASHKLDGVLLYSWGTPKYWKIARAIRESGAKLIIYLDTAKGFYPFYDWVANTSLSYQHGRQKGLPGMAVFAARTLVQNGFSWLLSEPRRKRHLASADMITLPFPSILEKMSRRNIYYGHFFAERLGLVCCPIASHFDYAGEIKKEVILAIGRWDDHFQKRPGFLMETLELALARDGDAAAHIVGSGVDQMQSWLAKLPEGIARRVRLTPTIANTEMPNLYKSAMISLCPSRFEATHMTSAEALCCGCSIVAPGRSDLDALKWYAGEQSGSISGQDTPESLAQTLLDELAHWRGGRRDPARISSIWTSRFHAVESAKRILEWDATGVLPGFG